MFILYWALAWNTAYFQVQNTCFSLENNTVVIDLEGRQTPNVCEDN